MVARQGRRFPITRAFFGLATVMPLLATPIASADWLQWGGNANHSQRGDAFSGTDVVLDARWPTSSLPFLAGPIVMDRRVFFSISAPQGPGSQVKVADMDTAIVEDLFSTPFTIEHLLAVDGSFILVGQYGELESWSLDGARSWSLVLNPCTATPLNPVASNCSYASYGKPRCGIPAAADGVVFVPCVVRDEATNPNGANCGEACATLGFAQAVRASDHATVWNWFRSTSRNEPPEPSDPLNVQYGGIGNPIGIDLRPMGATVTGQHVAVTYSVAYYRGGGPSLPFVVGADVSFVPRAGPDPTQDITVWQYNVGRIAFEAGAAQATQWQFFPPAVARDGLVAAQLDHVYVAPDTNPQQSTGRRFALGPRERYAPGDAPPGSAWGDLLYVGHDDGVVALTDTARRSWEFVLPEPFNAHAGAPVLAGPWLIVVGAHGIVIEKGRAFYRAYELFALDTQSSGDLLWRLPLDGEPKMAASGGVLAVLIRSSDGSSTARLLILGTTAANPKPAASVSTQYPAVGEEVRIDASPSGLGALGSSATYRMTWDDATTTEWQSSPMFLRRFTSEVDTTVFLSVRNEDNQTGTAPLTFYVSRCPPLNWAQQQFAAANQERTFFLLGLLATLIAALVGFLLTRRRRNIVRRELDAMSFGLSERADALEKEAFLRERRARFAELHAEGDVDEGQWALLDRRADLHMREIRIGTSEHDLAFLPFGLMSTLRRTLDDGRVTSAEFDVVGAVIEKDPLMTAAQKRKAKALIARWRDADEAAAARPAR